MTRSNTLLDTITSFAGRASAAGAAATVIAALFSYAIRSARHNALEINTSLITETSPAGAAATVIAALFVKTIGDTAATAGRSAAINRAIGGIFHWNGSPVI